jgi:hypothetical protein
MRPCREVDAVESVKETPVSRVDDSKLDDNVQPWTDSVVNEAPFDSATGEKVVDNAASVGDDPGKSFAAVPKTPRSSLHVFVAVTLAVIGVCAILDFSSLGVTSAGHTLCNDIPIYYEEHGKAISSCMLT